MVRFRGAVLVDTNVILEAHRSGVVAGHLPVVIVWRPSRTA